MSSPTVRILLRYLIGLLVAKGFFAPELGNVFLADPEVIAELQILLGLALGAAVEGWYAMARRFGWAR